MTKAAQNGQAERVNFLIKQGADMNQRDNNDSTALMHASNGKCVEFLIKAGADVNAEDNHGNTALFPVNPMPLRIDEVKSLLKAGAHINVMKNPVLRKNWKKFKINEQIIILLLAAGEKLERFRGEDIPETLKFEKERLQLKHMCKDSIRKHLLDIDPHANLFGRVPQLPLPSALKSYLLYNMSLDSNNNKGLAGKKKKIGPFQGLGVWDWGWGLGADGGTPKIRQYETLTIDNLKDQCKTQ